MGLSGAKRTPKVIKNIHAIKKLQVCEFGHFCEKFTSDDPSKLIGCPPRGKTPTNLDTIHM